jgi:hypothetical protein
MSQELKMDDDRETEKLHPLYEPVQVKPVLI